MKIKFVRSFVQSDMLRIIIELFNFTLLLLVIFLYVTGSEKTADFAQDFKIELLVLQDRVALKQ